MYRVVLVLAGPGELSSITSSLLRRKRKHTENGGREVTVAKQPRVAKQPCVAKTTREKPRKGGVGGLDGVWHRMVEER